MIKKTCLLIGWLLPALVLQSNAQTCIDMAATAATKNLFTNLYSLQKEKIIFGQQDALAYGVGWKYEKGRSDIHAVVKDRPGIYGWDIGGIELDSSKNLDGVPFSMMKEFIKDGYKKGAVITISWHMRNPFTGGSAWDTTKGSLPSILPGGSKASAYTHIARTVCRRAERVLVDLNQQQKLPEDLLLYMNRLSDFLFVASRWIHHKKGVRDVQWKKGFNRPQE